MMNSISYRFCTLADIDEVSSMLRTVFAGHEEFFLWPRMLFDGTHPTARPEHTLVAIDNDNGRVVSAICGVPQICRCDHLPLPVVNLAIVGTLPEYQGQGIMRSQMQVIHQWAEEQGYLATMVFGIPGLYTRFGYHPVLPFGGGMRYSAGMLTRKFSSTTELNILFRPVTMEDLPFLAKVHECAVERYQLSFPYDEGYWKLSAFDYFEMNRDQVRVITTANGVPIGMIDHGSGGGTEFGVINFELMPGVSWLEVVPQVMRYLLKTGHDYASQAGETFDTLVLSLGPAHPAYEFLEDVAHVEQPTMSGYLRFTNLPALFNHLSPLLESRLAASPLCGYTRQVSVELFGNKQGLVLTFDHGKLIDTASQPVEYGDVQMSELNFVRLITGQQSIDELSTQFREVNSWNCDDGLSLEYKILFRILFPKRLSFIYPCL